MDNRLRELEDLFIKVQAGEIPYDVLYFKIWPIAQTLPRKELNQLVDNIYEWAETRKKDDPESFGFTCTTRGLMDFISERHQNALNISYTAQQIFEELNNQEGIGVCKVTMGAVFRSLGDIDLSLKSFTEAWEILREDKKYNFLNVIAVYNLAEIYAASKHYDESIKYYLEVLESGAEYEYLFPLFFAGLGMVYHHMNQNDKAEDYLNQALTISLEKNVVPFTRSRILSDLATYYFDMGNYEASIARNEEALTLREGANILGGAVTNMLQLAEIYSLQHKDQDAIAMLNRALGIAESIRVKPKMAQVHHLLSKIYENIGDTANGLLHHKAFFRINEEANFEDAEKKVRNTLVIFEAEHERKENAIIRAQKKEIEQKNRELQHTIEELTLTKISRKAKAISFSIAIALFIIEDTIIHFFVAPYVHENFMVSLGANGIIIFCIKPIERVIEHFLLQKFVMKKRKAQQVIEEEKKAAGGERKR